jgi:psiF repeat-containing protein
MKPLTVALCLALALPAYAQEKKPTPAQMDQQKRMMDCNARSGNLKSDERKKFMSACMKGEAANPAQKKQQERMKECSRRAADKGLTGDPRMKFMSECLKAGDGELKPRGLRG